MNKHENDILGAILGAAIMNGLAEEAKAKPETDTPPKTRMQEKAEELRGLYNSFIEVGFTEEQATRFIVAILN